MKFGVVGKIISLVVIAVMASVGLLLAIGFYVNYGQVDNAAGEELIGCANITSGLLSPSEIKGLAAGKAADGLQDKINWIVDHKPIFKNASILSLDGTILVADKRLQTEGFKAGDKFYLDTKAIEMIKSMKHPYASGIYKFGSFERKTGYAPIFEDHDPNKQIVAFMAIDFDAKVISDRTKDMLMFTVETGGIFPIIAAVVAYFLIRRMIKPIEAISTRLKAIAEGDLSGEPIQAKSKDEIGTLVNSVNHMTKNLQDIITKIDDTSRSVTVTTQSLASDSEKSVESMNTMVAAMQQIASGAEMQETGTTESARAMEEMAQGINQIAESSIAVTEMMQETLAEAEQGQQALDRVLEQMGTIQQSVEHSTTVAEDLQSRSDQIESIIQVMSDISTQTNLLALNASIEASRAGEHGRGFGVVAEEIRKLAEQSRSSSEQIAELIEAIRSSIRQMSVSMDREKVEVASGRQVVTQLAGALHHIVEKAEQTNKQITEISSVSQEISAGTEEVTSSVHNMAGIARHSSEQSRSVTKLSEGQISFLEQISEAAHRINRMNMELTSMVNQFRL